MLGPGCATIRHADYVRSDAPTAMTFDRPRIRIDRASSGLHLTYDIAQTQRYDREEVLAAWSLDHTGRYRYFNLTRPT
jgi:hypothetical protein